MKQNLHLIDRLVRLILGLGLVWFLLTAVLSQLLIVVMGILAVILIVTSIFSHCPLYRIFGLSTKKRRSSPDIF
jgi:hypothetical protein